MFSNISVLQVRKDKWIRKRKVRMVGATFRKNSDLPPDAFASFGLSRQPDWSFADGTPGYLVSYRVFQGSLSF